MASIDWNWRLPSVLQTTDWTCSCCSVAWALQTIGIPADEWSVASGMGSNRVNSAVGLTDASGQGIVDYLLELGVIAENNADASWEEIVAASGSQPMVVGGRGWNHWTGVRVGPQKFNSDAAAAIWIANPAPGWMGVENVLWRDRFDGLGPFSAVWFQGWP